MRVGRFQPLHIRRGPSKRSKQLLSQCLNLFLDLIFIRPARMLAVSLKVRNGSTNALFILQLKPQLQTLYFNLSFSFVLEDGCIGLTMLRRSDIPRRCSLFGSFVPPQRGQVAHNITIGSAIEDGQSSRTKCSTSEQSVPSTRGRKTNSIIHGPFFLLLVQID